MQLISDELVHLNPSSWGRGRGGEENAGCCNEAVKKDRGLMYKMVV